MARGDSGWAPPRGPRDRVDPLSGRWTWRWSLRWRDMGAESFGSQEERDAVVVLRDLVLPLVQAREASGVSMRGLADAAQVPLSVLTGLEQGSSWPRLDTLRRVAGVLGFEVVLNGKPEIVVELVALMGQRRLSSIAVFAGVRRQTLYDLKAPGRPLSMETLLRVTGSLNLLSDMTGHRHVATWGLSPLAVSI